MFVSTLYVRRFQRVSTYLTELRLTYQEQSVYFINNSLIKPLILYCSVTWTSCCSHDNINKILKLQKRCARIILDAQQRHNTVDLFNILAWVPYYIESDIKRCLMAYKRIMGICPTYINELLELNNSQHSRNTRGANFTILPRRYIREKREAARFLQKLQDVGITSLAHFSICKYFEECFI